VAKTCRRTELLGDFHVRMAEQMGNQVLAQMLGELISRCALITLMYQTHAAAEHSSDEHAAIIEALEAGDETRAVTLMDEHLTHVEASLAFDRKLPTHDSMASHDARHLRHHQPYPRDLIGYGPHLRSAPSPCSSVCPELRRRRRKRRAAWRPGLGTVPVRNVQPGEFPGPASEHGRHLRALARGRGGSCASSRRGLPLTVFGVAMALQRHPELTAAFRELGHEIACHGWRWINYQAIDEATEREHMRIGMEIIERLTGERPLGWYTGRDSPNTRRLVADHGGFLYDADYYGDDLPFWAEVTRSDGARVPHLVVPYTLDTNDMRFALPQGFSHGGEFFDYLRDAFDVLYAEGDQRPAMLSVGMHCRLLGRPGRFRALQRFLDHLEQHDRVWICRRVDVARHWIAHHPFSPRG
jgi:peptidoglycan/xylan/chitin deacetylase (PgdA/CDA1 family)